MDKRIVKSYDEMLSNKKINLIHAATCISLKIILLTEAIPKRLHSV